MEKDYKHNRGEASVAPTVNKQVFFFCLFLLFLFCFVCSFVSILFATYLLKTMVLYYRHT